MTLITFLLLFFLFLCLSGHEDFQPFFIFFDCILVILEVTILLGYPLSHLVLSKIVINGERHLKNDFEYDHLGNQVGVVKNVIFHLFGPFLTIFWVPEGSHESSMARQQ